MKPIPVLLLLCVLFYSCTKKQASQTTTTNPPQTVSYSISDYTKLTVGNYWVYSIYNKDSLGNETYQGTDSSYVKGDTLINGNSYAIICGVPPVGTGYPQYYRDSSTFYVDRNGRIDFTTTDFNTILFTDSILGIDRTYFEVPSTTVSVTVPYGTCTCYDYEGIIKNSPLFPNKVKYSHTYYAPNVGILELVTYYASFINQCEYKLVRAHIH